MEDNSIDFIAENLKLGMLIQNTQFFENDFLTGTPDIIIPDFVFDVKNPWDFSTFPLLETEIPNTDYYWQGQGYMWLTGRKKYKLIYVLSDTPLHLIRKEAYYYCMDNGYDELDDDVYQDFVNKMTYPDVPDHLKIKIFEFERNDEDIERIKERVLVCRKIQKQILGNLKKINLNS